MKNQNKANAGRTQIADISVAGKELSEEHLRIVGGGLGVITGAKIETFTTYKFAATCVQRSRLGNCTATQTDSVTAQDPLTV